MSFNLTLLDMQVSPHFHIFHSCPLGQKITMKVGDNGANYKKPISRENWEKM